MSYDSCGLLNLLVIFLFEEDIISHKAFFDAILVNMSN